MSKANFNKYTRGSEWRRWDLHVHTKFTNKNDNFKSKDFDTFCKKLFEEAIRKEIVAIGVTDYFSIDNYTKVIAFQNSIGSNVDFNEEEKSIIKDIFILPNVELRMIPVTDKGRLVNIHCIFNPSFVDDLDNEFFNEIKHTGGDGSEYSMNRQGLIKLGESLDPTLQNDDSKYKKGINNFIVSHESLQKLKNKSKLFCENTIVVVSNSNTDGASAFQQHYDLFEDVDTGSLDGLRKAIYSLSDAVFSSNSKDRDYFIGAGKDDIKTVKLKCKSLKPCIHGSDAHCEDDLFNPNENRFCWIKADPNFDGLKQILYEPDTRVYIGDKPEVLDRVENKKTKYINQLTIKKKDRHTSKFGIWFDNVTIPLNSELVTIIGNKGSGKSAVSDIIGLLGDTKNAGKDHSNFTFLNNSRNQKRFRQTGFAENFEAELSWKDGSISRKSLDDDLILDDELVEKVRYLPQNFFEKLTNEIEGNDFSHTLNQVIFNHIPDADKLNTQTFEELEEFMTNAVAQEINALIAEIVTMNHQIIKLENLKSEGNIKKLENLIYEKKKELAEHDKNEPSKVADPAQNINMEDKEKQDKKLLELEIYNTEIEKVQKDIDVEREKLRVLMRETEELKQFKTKLLSFKEQITKFLDENSTLLENNDLEVKAFESPIDIPQIDIKVKTKTTEITQIEEKLKDESIIREELVNEEDINNAISISLLVSLEELQSKREILKKELSEPQKIYQQYLEKHRKWKEQRSALEGKAETADTLRFYETQLDYINDSQKLLADLTSMRKERLGKSIEIYSKKKEILKMYEQFKGSIDKELSRDKEFKKKFNMTIDANFVLDSQFTSKLLNNIQQGQGGTFYGKEEGEKEMFKIIEDKNLQEEIDIRAMLEYIIESLETDKRPDKNLESRDIVKQVKNREDFYKFLFSLDYLSPNYQLRLDDKKLQELSPGEKGALLLVFYLLIDTEEIPLVIDQPEDNLDNKSVYEVLTHFIQFAKKRRQIILVTHNPNLAVGADAEQIIYVNLDKKDKYKFSYISGGIENPEINRKTVEVLEGTMPAFDKRKLKYFNY